MASNRRRRGEAPKKPPKDSPPTVVVEDLWVRYRTYASGKRVRQHGKRPVKARDTRYIEAVKGVSFVVREGESIGVIGHNGSGKSSLLQAIAGLIPPSQGAVYASSRPSLLGVNSILLRDLSGEKNIVLGGLALGYTRKEIEERKESIVSFAGLEDFLEFPMRAYSAGMSARLRFSVAVSRQHSIMLVDEALSVGDRDFRERSEARMREMCKDAGTVFLVSHSMGSIRSTCNRVLWIDGGELRMDGDPDDVIPAYEKSQDERARAAR